MVDKSDLIMVEMMGNLMAAQKVPEMAD